MIWFYIITVGCYSIAVYALWIGFEKVPHFLLRKLPAKTKFSVVIVFRNEAENLPALMRSLQQLDYPTSHFEVLFVNDASADHSEAILVQAMEASNIEFQLLQNTSQLGSPKKQAIALAISHAANDWVITTDADCTVPSDWLTTYNDFIHEKDPICIAAPVAYEGDGTWLQDYQQLDNYSLQGVTIGSFGLGNVLLSNGANFAYRKASFYEVNGFKGNMHIASGDDMFLLEKFKNKHPKQIYFLKSQKAIVTTQPVSSWRHLFSQRIRWASKTKKQNGVAAKLLGLLVFSTNLSVMLFPISLLLSPDLGLLLLILLVVKFQADLFLLRSSSKFLLKKLPLIRFIVVYYLHAVITVCVVITSLFAGYTWKKRSFNT